MRLWIQQNSTDQTNIEWKNSEMFRAKHCCEQNRTKQNTKLIPFLSDSVDTLTALQLRFECNCVVCSTVWCAGGACACDRNDLNENFYLKLWTVQLSIQSIVSVWWDCFKCPLVTSVIIKPCFMLFSHRKKKFISCDAWCWCWC